MKIHRLLVVGYGYSQDEAFRSVIENFINSTRVTHRTEYYNEHAVSVPHNKINHVEIAISEPFKSIFEQIFDTSEWKQASLELN